ncbi:MAG: bifunctional aspartate kinase/homoserine dehydrogenase I [Calditrichaceae bacterium]|nr:bifunctional aspartate kinase/homoserine dehydrogenase I [Calditrichaceae bacterium]MBN2708273.1 bifunctional aspartate kinase/homoserine dehydrogenase I [Calditrichaceae bacterium]RQV95200.1 MAG: bifunctional aspartate kinase/homoserine dehydrogenase I [Calditrichota bacterium]
MKVMKFGGSSVGNCQRIKDVVEIIKHSFSNGRKGVVVFSAYQGVTDQLIECANLAASGSEKYSEKYEALHQKHIAMARELLSIQRQSNILAELTYQLHQLEEILHGVFLVKEISPRTQDYIMSFGERLSAFTISECLKDSGFTNSFLDTRQLIKTDLQFGRARVDFKQTNRNIKSYFDEHPEIQIATGFIASGYNGETTTLGRGGSDFTASIFGAALGVKEIEIWTDVDGVLTADPCKVKSAFPIKRLSYEEAMELSHFGAKVIYPPTMQPALDKSIPLRIKNTMNPAFEGTLVASGKPDNPYLITGLSSIGKIALLTIQGSGMIGVVGIAERIFRTMAREHINIILITQASSEHSICLAIMPQNKTAAVNALKEELKYEIRDDIINEIKIEDDLSIIAVVGDNMRRRRGLAGKVFQALGENDINIIAIAQGSSELNISIVIARQDEKKALTVIHDAFFDSGMKKMNVFLLGTGIVGGTLLKIINKQKRELLKRNKINMQLAGIANIDGMLVDSNGIDVSHWEPELKEKGKKIDLKSYCEDIVGLKLKNSVFVDCTASAETAELYLTLLRAGVHVVAANKKANTENLEFYNQLQNISLERGIQFRYETNVGAGLPVIQTIKDLIASGDRINRIEGILSGTLSYIFNQYASGKSFAAIVKQAKDKGYTEPDPRDDLSGMDVARKILILAREAGWQKDLNDVEVENLTPVEARQVKGLDQFFKTLEKHDADMENKIVKAEKSGQRLRYIAVANAGKLKAQLTAVNPDHPFYNLQGSDNIVAIYSDYYPVPLVIRGAGAGPEVTAAGVFADILKLVNG